jgi:hypothetical protein
MTELIPTDNGSIRNLSVEERWCAAVTVCDEAPDARQAAYVLQMLGLIEPAPEIGGYLPVGEDDDGEIWYPPSPFTRPHVKAVGIIGSS